MAKRINRLWMPKGKVDGEEIFLTHCIGRSRRECIEKIMETARREGFAGTIEERLQQLSWDIAEVEFKELNNG